MAAEAKAPEVAAPEETYLTFAEVKAHDSKADLYMVIHDVVYDASKFVYEHPGGEEVMLDYAGVDATDAFEDVGHSDEARDVLNKLEVAKLRRLVRIQCVYRAYLDPCTLFDTLWYKYK
jgi:cytochrome b involved in lipid metabolism